MSFISLIKLRANILFLILPGLFISCAASRIPTLAQRPGCETSIEGYYHCADLWLKAKPALIIRQGMEMKIITGTIVSTDSDGVTFDPTGEGQLRDPKPEYFHYKKIEALIGDNGEVLHGTIPPVYSRAYALELHLVPLYKPEPEPINVTMEPNKQFGFCVPPGDYSIDAIMFRNDYQKMVDEGIGFPKLTISVEEGRSNYIGDLYLDCRDFEQSKAVAIPYKISHRPSEAMNNLIFDVATSAIIGGVVIPSAGTVAEDAAESAVESVVDGLTTEAFDEDGKLRKEIIGIHLLFIQENPDSEIKGTSPRTDNIMKKG